jgi:5-methylcytosine-specific restriction enzyme B
MKEFTWIQIYREIANRVLDYENRQDELIGLLKEISSAGIPIISLDDKDVGDRSIEIEQIDPFSFFAIFNRGIRNESRLKILEILRQKWSLQNGIPEDFNGVPVVNNLRSWYFHWKKDRTAGEIPALWAMAREAFSKPAQQMSVELFDKCVKQSWLGMITIGMFWINPYEYLSLDGVNTAYLKRCGLNPKRVKNGQDYLDFLAKVRETLDVDFPQRMVRSQAWRTNSCRTKGPSRLGHRSRCRRKRVGQLQERKNRCD